MSSQFQLGKNSPELNFISIRKCQLEDVRGTPPGFCSEISGGEISTKKSLELIFERCHLTFDLKLFWNEF